MSNLLIVKTINHCGNPYQNFFTLAKPKSNGFNLYYIQTILTNEKKVK